MGKEPGRPKKGRLVDMTIHPPTDPQYELPPPEECEDETWPVVLAPRHELRARRNVWRDCYIVEFAIMQIVLIDGHWREIARIDTCHSSVHRHYLRKDHPEDSVGIRVEIAPIPMSNGWEVVDSWYDRSLKLMEDEWQENLRRWGGDFE
ncbi:DUF7718 family protein [Catelliglobosispora koreensis]|uniref:DUF7718 family protein n=1 Tax=Catelliglobosispora koreensis TaxID=129052 RepID=UPI0012F8D877|nr:hypothetical protein [Catelliglobosispora koreensis]